jgi:hypothetical protein
VIDVASLIDTEPGILQAEALSTNAFRNLVIHEMVHIILLIAVCCVLPRYKSRVIHRLEFSNLIGHVISSNVSTICSEGCCILKNDPSAGSPTDTVLRLLHPLDDKAHDTSLHNATQGASHCGGPCNLPDHPIG